MTQSLCLKKKRGRLNYAEETRGELNAKGVVAGDL